ncbi:hypothetical protein KO527_10745 [Pseudoalteromonas sp. C2R02]|uniref:hypothetical protein n=1 Tax=Pseudoalteromonas sp. C2R02 TaxID=2841565 RepID=UPI001C09D9B5|nr:hypothetical protein [Pseudoalteromonas sp. C2R02]MBU2969824.1 hypothetical protein [Pseudoalteromonas sp. C2R02]
MKVLDRIYPFMTITSKSSKKVISTSPQNQTGLTFQSNLLNKNTADKNQVTGLKKKASAIKIIEVKDLYSYPLKNYLSGVRKINLDITNQYIKEVTCQVITTGKVFYSIGFPSGITYALRNKNFKGFA